MTQHPYNVILARHSSVPDVVKEYLQKKLEKLERLSDKIIDIHVTFDHQKSTHTVTILLHFGHYMIKSEGRNHDIYVAIDQASSRIQHLLQKYKSKLTDHHAAGHAEINMLVDIYNQPSETDRVNDAIEEENTKRESKRFAFHKIVRQEKRPLKTLSSEEALMMMEFSLDQFLLYRDKKDQKLKLIYRMPDENYGIIQTP